MPMTVVYALDPLPETIASSSLFLAGGTPRSSQVPSWRPEALRYLEEAGYEGVVFVPEARADNPWDEKNWSAQVEWERLCLNVADQVVFWVPRNMETMLCLTTNTETGLYVSHEKCVFGAPTDAVHVKYQEKMFLDDAHTHRNYTVEATIYEAVDNINLLCEGFKSTIRTGGSRYVPLHIWTTPMFQSWITAQGAVGNRLDEAKLLWVFRMPKARSVFSYVLWVKVWIESEQRYKENEFILSRTDISTVVMHGKVDTRNILDTEIVLVKEFRSPVRNTDCMVHECAGGSSVKPNQNPLQVASDEVHEETGIILSPDRIRKVGARQLVSTLSTHQAHVYVAELTDTEMLQAKQVAKNQTTHGVTEDSERTYLEVLTLGNMLKSDTVDWSNVGMVLQALLSG